MLEEAARLDPALLSEAAEMSRRAGDLDRALLLNSQVSDQKEKARQRLAILVEMKRYEEAAAMEPRLSRLGLLEDEDVRYALAYSYFMTRRFDPAREHLKKITRADLFRSAAQLFKAMEVCEQDPLQCGF